jgi:signal transduction histidine kinase
VVDGGGTAAPRAAGGTAGSGLAGLRERVGLVGGEIAAGPLADGTGWEVTARLPVASARR